MKPRCLPLALFGSSAMPTPYRPHILLMLADDWGSYDAAFRQRSLGRRPDVSTPAIDELAARGVVLSSYYVQPLCSPTRASLLTGRYSTHTGAENSLFYPSEPACLPLSLPLLPRALAALGYQSHMIGKWHLGYAEEGCAPWARGFESFFGYLNGAEGYVSHGFSGAADFHDCATADCGADCRAADRCTAGCSAGVCSLRNGTYEGRYSTHLYARRVQGLLESWADTAERRAGISLPLPRPLFVYVAWQVPPAFSRWASSRLRERTGPAPTSGGCGAPPLATVPLPCESEACGSTAGPRLACCNRWKQSTTLLHHPATAPRSAGCPRASRAAPSARALQDDVAACGRSPTCRYATSRGRPLSPDLLRDALDLGRRGRQRHRHPPRARTGRLHAPRAPCAAARVAASTRACRTHVCLRMHLFLCESKTARRAEAFVR